MGCPDAQEAADEESSQLRQNLFRATQARDSAADDLQVAEQDIKALHGQVGDLQKNQGQLVRENKGLHNRVAGLQREVHSSQQTIKNIQVSCEAALNCTQLQHVSPLHCAAPVHLGSDHMLKCQVSCMLVQSSDPQSVSRQFVNVNPGHGIHIVFVVLTFVSCRNKQIRLHSRASSIRKVCRLRLLTEKGGQLAHAFCQMFVNTVCLLLYVIGSHVFWLAAFGGFLA